MSVLLILATVFFEIVFEYFIITRLSKYGRISLAIALVTSLVFVILTIYSAMLAFILSALLVAFLIFFMLMFCLLKKIPFIKRHPLSLNSINIASLVLSMIMTFCYLSYSFFVAYDIQVTTYSIKSEKELNIVQLSDLHIASHNTTSNLRRIVNQVNELNPDLVVITGDFVDENTTRSEMVKACNVLSDLSSRYGTYYVVGNHDYRTQGYDIEDTLLCLEENGVSPLLDQMMLIGDDYLLLGRKDTSIKSRKSISALLSLANEYLDREIIILDHQPVEYDSYLSSDLDEYKMLLILSGHTHGGQLFPVNLFYNHFMHSDDLTYGYERRGCLNYIVSSGVGGGTIPLKNGAPSEIVNVIVSCE